LRKVILPVLGGIGNQLFQLSALVNLPSDYELAVDSNLFSDSSNFNKLTLSELHFERVLHIEEYYTAHRLSRKLMGLLLRYSVWQNMSSSHRAMHTFLKVFTQFILSRRYGLKVSLLVLSEVGYEKIAIPDDRKSLVILGYCQSYKYHSSIDVLRESFRVNSSVSERIGFSPVELAKRELPLIVHIRRGDYLLNPKLGVLAQSFYLENIERVLTESQARSIWVFANEVNFPLSFIPEQFKIITKVMNFDNISDLESLEIMKLGHAFLIANSSYSWWAAYLSKAEHKNIYAPEPWFSGLANPLGLLPPSWRKLKPKFETIDLIHEGVSERSISSD